MQRKNIDIEIKKEEMLFIVRDGQSNCVEYEAVRIRKLIEERVVGRGKQVVILPMGSYGHLTKQILNDEYCIKEAACIDNNNYDNESVFPLDMPDVFKKIKDDCIFLMSVRDRNISADLRKKLYGFWGSGIEIIDIFSNTGYKEKCKRPFIVNEELKYRINLILDGFDYYAKVSLLWLAMRGLKTDGFLADGSITIPFFGKEIKCIDSINKDESIVCLNEAEAINRTGAESGNVVHIAENNMNGESILIIGDDTYGDKAVKQFQSMLPKLKVEYIEFEKDRWGTPQIIPKLISQRINKFDYDSFVLAADINENEAEYVIREIEKQYLSEGYLYDFTMYLRFILTNGREQKIWWVTINHWIQDGKRVYLYGEKSDIDMISSVIRCIGIDAQGIDRGGFIGTEKNTKYIDIYDLFYMDLDKTGVFVLDGYEDEIRQFISESGISSDIFGSNVPHRNIEYITVLDPTLGYSALCQDEMGLFHFPQKCSKGMIKVGVLGGSTSDATLYKMKSWPEQLHEVAKEHGVDIEVINGAVGGYGTSQELMKLIRDMLFEKPDIVISYSGINEKWAGTEHQHFISRYAASLYEEWNDSLNAGRLRPLEVCYGEGYGKSIEEHWFDMERMMHAICDEYNVKFYGICQVAFCDLIEAGRADLNQIGAIDISPHTELLSAIRSKLKACDYEWIYDASDLITRLKAEHFMDYSHLTTEGNRIVAEYIFELVFKERAIA